MYSISLYYTMPYYTLLCCTILYYTILYFTIRYHTGLCKTILYIRPAPAQRPPGPGPAHAAARPGTVAARPGRGFEGRKLSKVEACRGCRLPSGGSRGQRPPGSVNKNVSSTILSPVANVLLCVISLLPRSNPCSGRFVAPQLFNCAAGRVVNLADVRRCIVGSTERK